MTYVDSHLDAVGVNKVFHDHECAYYDDRFAIVHDRRTARQAAADVERLLGRRIRSGERILDAGCGTGYLAAGLRRARPEAYVTGADLSAGMLGRAREAGAHPLVQADAARLPFADRSYDLVVARGVLQHLPDVTAALTEWRRVLAPGGAVVLVSEPTPTVERHGALVVRALLAALRRPLTAEEDFWEVASMAANLHVFTPESLAAHARDAGFGDVALDTVDFADTLLITASYVAWGRSPRLARLVPWRAADEVARLADRAFWNAVLPASWRHTVAGVLR